MTRIDPVPRLSSPAHLTPLVVPALLVLLTTIGGTVAAQSSPTQQLRGRVLTADGGTPLPGSRILLGLRVVGRTDDTGRFDITVAKGKTPVWVEKAGYIAEEIKGTGLNLEARLTRSATLVVRVIDEAGNLVGRRPLRVAGPFGLVRRATDDVGITRLTGLEAGRYVADLYAFPVPAASHADDRAEQSRRDFEARQEMLARRDSGTQLKAGQEVTMTIVDSWRPSSGSRKDSRGGTIRGRVTGPDDLPVRGARVVLTAPLEQQTVLTGSDGAYVFENVAPGTYKLHGQALGLMPAQHGQEPGVEGKDVVVMTGQRLDDVNVRLFRGGVVNGTVRDEFGEPHELISVQLYALKPGTRELVGERSTTIATTDEHGRFRISGVMSGTYGIIARPRAGRSEGPVYYPDKLQFADATPLRVTEGGELTGIDMTTNPGRGARVSGIVTDSKGAPLQAGSVVLHGTTRATIAVAERSTQIDAGGHFEFLSVPAGGYALTVGSPLPFSSLTINGLLSDPVKLQFPTRESGGVDLVVVDGRTINAPIQTSPRAMVTGYVVLDDPDARVSPSSFVLSAARGNARSTVVGDDGTFQLRDLTARTRLTLTAAPPGWWLKSITVKNVNVAEVPMEFGLAQHSRHGVIAVLSRTAARLTGQVLDTAGAPVPHAPVVVFTVDRSRWEDRSLHRQQLQTDADGRFTASVAPGEYWVAAADASEPGTRTLERLTKTATRVTAAPSGEVKQDLRIAAVRRE